MISHVSIQNFAIIKDLSIDFDKGLCMITGETGAGKSIIIEAVNLALGSRADTTYVRNGEEKAKIQLVVDVDNPSVLTFLNENGIDQPSQLFITREIHASGKSVCKLNGEMVSVSFLNKICRRLVDIHGQYDHQSLLNPQHHIDLVDAFCASDLEDPKIRMQADFKAYEDARHELGALSGKSEERQRQHDFLHYELNEINAAALKPGEDDELEARLTRLQNSEKILSSISMIHALLTGESDTCTNPLPSAKNLLEDIASYDQPLQEFSAVLSDCYYKLEDLASQMRRYRDSISFSEEEIDETIARLEIINALKRKHGGCIESVLAHGEKIAAQIATFQNSDERIKELHTLLPKLEMALTSSSRGLSALRQKAAVTIEEQMMWELSELNFASANFHIAFHPTESTNGRLLFTENGIDNIEFMISTNKGEPLKPLVKIASGGEISRIMLAFKRIVGDYDDIASMIFDEIDTGISGASASIIGKKLLQIAQKKQVICITHLPQVAAFGLVNYKIEKETKTGQTFAGIRRLSDQEKAEELARMLGGIHIGESALQNAYELIRQSK